MDKVIVGGSLIPSTVDTPLDKRTRVATFAEIANIENPARYMTIVVEDTGRHYEVRKLSSKVIGGLVVENAGIDIDDPEALYDLTAVEEARVEAERKREEEEDTRKRNEETRIENETERGVNESQRQLSEDERESSEISREEHEQIRMTNESERKENEISRQSKELSREQYEASRKSSETERRNSENKRIENENTRKSNESQREINENQRKSNETERQSKENTRISAEDRRLASEATREANELNRKNNESTRVQNETERVSNENARVKSENERKTEYAGLKSELEEQIENAKNYDSRKANIDGQYDKLTSGNSQNLIGRGNATPEEFNFRPSGDISIQDGTARVKKLKGNSVVYNQLCNEKSKECTLNAGLFFEIFFIKNITNSAKYLFSFTSETPLNGRIVVVGAYANGNYCELSHNISNSTIIKYLFDKIYPYSGNVYFRFYPDDTTEKNIYVDDIQIHNITKMYEGGNEPTTVEEFESLYPDSYYECNPGEIKSLTATAIKSVGFNAWDEEWMIGGISPTTGGIDTSNDKIMSKNYIPIIGGETYHIKYSGASAIWVALYDNNKNILKGISLQEASTTYNNIFSFIPNTNVVFPHNCSFIRFYMTADYGLVYKNNICINLSNTGYRNGEYEPYKEFVRELPINKIKDSEGNLLFPEGLCSAGSVYDEITEKKAIKRIGKVDLGTLSWKNKISAFDGGVYFIDISVNDKKLGMNLLCSKYTPTNIAPGSEYPDKSIYGYNTYHGNNTLIIYDSSYTDAASLKESLQGVYLYYELATPIEVDLDPEVNMDYEVWDFGTEQMISDGFSTPIKAEIVYGFNAVDRIRENSLNIEDLIKRIVQLETKITNLETTQANENTQVD